MSDEKVINTIELRGCLSESKTQVAFPKDGGAKIALDTDEQFEDAAYLLRKHMKTCSLKITFDVIERDGVPV